ncbi:PRC-barrel domain-containing protein [Profundibacterium mesophilum]|uniref:PRC-barrel domain containing protein n=1 Tax=Profundibacterium mesophilum KAUST100406-0324 TaxID=1037889 RepID=A0A921NPW2_9RHOB|nr:PRC-barrel domain-containing protein [Profundibacterium mesophilum]KAF0676416.1 PRC-barrel domain containing protein [Profundibacterium mesophilum KAUST100406-0324]
MTHGNHDMVSSSDVNGTEVYSEAGEHVGTIDHLMIDKQSGKVAWAVMGFGGFLGLGEAHYPIPWTKLTYERSRGGFVTDISREQLEAAPSRPERWTEDRAWEEQAHLHYGAPFYWI